MYNEILVDRKMTELRAEADADRLGRLSEAARRCAEMCHGLSARARVNPLRRLLHRPFGRPAAL